VALAQSGTGKIFLKVPIEYGQQESKPTLCDLCAEPALNFFRDPELEIMLCQDCGECVIVAVKTLASHRIGPCTRRKR
jgi:hypothetical protein